MNSSNDYGPQNLATLPASRIQEFLAEAANTPIDELAVGRFMGKFGTILNTPEWLAWSQEALAKNPRYHQQGFGHRLHAAFEVANSVELLLLWNLQRKVRNIWESPDVRTARWRTFCVQYSIYDHLPVVAGTKDLDAPPATALQQCLTYLSEHSDLLKRCGNPDCGVTPYFFAKKRKQRYCSDLCAQPAQRAAKKRWWDEHGEVWRKKAARTRKVKQAETKKAAWAADVRRPTGR